MPAPFISPYSPDWPNIFEALREELLAVFAGSPVVVEHIGSTSVPGLSAKPVIDVLLGARSLREIESRLPALAAADYVYRPEHEQALPHRRYFTRTPASGLRVHLHAVALESGLWRAHLRFRDALRADAALRSEYQALKLRLATEHANDKTLYTAAKGPFIERVLARFVDDRH